MTFVKGQSGNPAGRPIGSRNKRTLQMEALLEEEGTEFVKNLLARARQGSDAAARLIIQRLVPVRRERPVPLALPRIESAQDVPVAIAEIAEAIGVGAITPREADDLVRLLDRITRTLQAAEAAAPG